MKNSKGIVYTIAIFLLAAALVELVMFRAEFNGQRARDVLPQADGEILLLRLGQACDLFQQAMGVEGKMARNSTSLMLNISDRGFPYVNNTQGKILLSQLKSWMENGWASQTNASISLDVSIPNSTGRLLSTSGKINYSHDNSDSSYDLAKFQLPEASTPTRLDINISCARSQNTSSLDFTDWANVGSGMAANISYYDAMDGLHANYVRFPATSEHNFNAKQLDPDGNLVQALHIDWVQPNYTLQIWSEGNSTYEPAHYKRNVSCSWNISIIANYTNASEQELYMPINASLTYGNASHAGYLVIARE